MKSRLFRWWPNPLTNILINELLSSSLAPDVLRAYALKFIGCDVDRGAQVKPGVRFGGSPLRLGPFSLINHSCLIDAHVYVGDRSAIGPASKLMTSTHEFGPHEWRAGASLTRPIVIGHGCWLGAGVIILPGVTIHDGCVIAAGSVVTSDCIPDGLYAGVPARLVRKLAA